MQPSDYDLIIIGAGAAGLLAASLFPGKPDRGPSVFPEEGRGRPFRGLILEGGGQPGRKLLMSGGGRCNFTHAGSIKDFVPHYGAGGRRIRSLLYRYHNDQFRRFLTENGIPISEESDGRVFPASGRASDILNLLCSLSAENQFSIRTDSRVCELKPIRTESSDAVSDGDDPLWEIITTDGRRFRAPCVILATGGCTYPKTGSDGSMFTVLQRSLGLAVTPLRPVLHPIAVSDYPFRDLAGISLSGVKLLFYPRREDGTLAKARHFDGDVLFTHRVFSGPAILNASRKAVPGGALVLRYLAGRTEDELRQALSGLRTWSAQEVSRVTGLPKRFCACQLERSGASPKRLARLLTEDRFEVTGGGHWNNAMVTCGGIDLSEMDLGTMACRRFPGLYAIGEMVDIDGETGGYNLQFAFSSAAACVEAISGRPIRM